MAVLSEGAPIQTAATPIGEAMSPTGIDHVTADDKFDALANIIRGPVARPRRVVVTGVPGIGKSTFAAASEKPVFIPTEDGVADIDCAKFPVARTLVDFRINLRAIYEGKHEFKTVVIDSVDWLEKLVQRDVCSRAGLDAITDFEWGKGFGKVAAEFEAMLERLDSIRDKGMNVILIAHTKIERQTPPNSDPYDKYVPDMHKNVSSLLVEWCDDLLFASYDIHTVSKKDGPREHTRAIGDRRILRTREQPYCLAKTHLRDLPEILPLDWAEYRKHWPK